METDKNIVYVGTLQELGRPYSMLYVDKEKRQLYILVRISQGKHDRFLAMATTPYEVKSYMNENIGLLNILSKHPYRIATISGNKISVGRDRFCNFSPTEQMKKMDMFDPELCDDDIWIEVFLNRMNNNLPIETA